MIKMVQQKKSEHITTFLPFFVMFLLHVVVDGRTSRIEVNDTNPIVKTIEDKNGNIFDCYIMEKQPGLEGHQIQVEPTNFPHVFRERSRKSFLYKGLSTFQCPHGSVPILRAERQHRRASLVPYPGQERQPSTSHSFNEKDNEAHYYASWGSVNSTFYGGRASFSMYGIDEIRPDQRSGAFVWLADDKVTEDHEVILAGWMVYPSLYHDKEPRLTAEWKASGKDFCLNTECPGYVQLHPTITLGCRLPIVGQTHLTITIVKDPKTRVWWLLVDDDFKKVGYWHDGLFSSLATSCNRVAAGGVVASPPNIPSPKMGNGNFPRSGAGKCAAVTDMLLIEEDRSFLIAPKLFRFISAGRRCYGTGMLLDGGHDFGPHFLYGGRGGCTS